MARGKSLSDQEAEQVRWYLRDIAKDFKNQREVAAALGVSQQTISRVLSGGTVGVDVAIAVARHRGESFEQTVGIRRKVYVGPPIAADFARVNGISEQAIEEVLSTADADMTPAELFDLMRHRERRLKQSGTELSYRDFMGYEMSERHWAGALIKATHTLVEQNQRISAEMKHLDQVMADAYSHGNSEAFSAASAKRAELEFQMGINFARTDAISKEMARWQASAEHGQEIDRRVNEYLHNPTQEHEEDADPRE